jgi:hypothetical protein
MRGLSLLSLPLARTAFIHLLLLFSTLCDWAQAPIIWSFSPTNGWPDLWVSISGTNLAGAVEVDFNRTPARRWSHRNPLAEFANQFRPAVARGTHSRFMGTRQRQQLRGTRMD